MIDCTGQSEVKYFYHLDGLGSVVALSNTSGTIVASYSVACPDLIGDVFGAATVTGNEYGNPYRFTARRYDNETAIYYQARIYHPNLSRILSRRAGNPTGNRKQVDRVHLLGEFFHLLSSPTSLQPPHIKSTTSPSPRHGT